MATVVVQTVVAVAVAFFFFRKNHFVLAGVLASAAGALVVCSVVWPAGYHGVQRAFQMLGVWLGRTVTYVLLVPCFVLVFGTARLLLLVSRRDPLGSRFLTGRATYWESHASAADPAKHLEATY